MIEAGAYKALLAEHVEEALADAKPSPSLLSLGAALAYLADVIRGPVLEERPELRSSWADMRCRDNVDGIRRHCHCGQCRWEERNLKRAEEWRRADALRPSERKPHAFGSLGDAVVRWVAWRETGGSLPSSLGPALDLVRDHATSGVTVRSTNASAEPAAAYLAGLSCDVERAIVAAASVSATSAVRTFTQLRLVVCSYVDGYDEEREAEALSVSVAIIRAAVRRTRKAATIELAAMELIPMPRHPLRQREVARRREELAA